tara:strand:- start:844 stop:1158 length:315 start_codon:yes stop_codon:yes gene_type:complete
METTNILNDTDDNDDNDDNESINEDSESIIADNTDNVDTVENYDISSQNVIKPILKPVYNEDVDLDIDDYYKQSKISFKASPLNKWINNVEDYKIEDFILEYDK